MDKKKLGVVVAVFFLIGAMFFPVVLYIQGVPIWWVFRNVKSLEIATPSQLIIEVSPKAPHNIGEEITATVTNSSSQLPVQGAEVDVTKDGTTQKVYTDANGIATFQYLGEVTVVLAQMDEIKSSDYVAIPNAPDAYVQGQNNAIISAVLPTTLGPLFTVLFTYLLQGRKTTKIKRQRTRKKKE
jgi:hypothetical protein